MISRRKAHRPKLAERINSYVTAEKPAGSLAGNLSKVARSAIDEANTLAVETTEIHLERLPPKLDGLRVVHLSDTHHSPFTSLDHIRSAVEVANALKPDLAVLTGDYVSHDAEYIAPVAKVLGELKAANGTHACLGNHDHWTDPELMAELLRKEDINVLLNEGFRLEIDGAFFWLAGVDDHMAGKTDVAAALRGSFPDEMKLLLAHNPVIFRQAVRAGVDLTLSGHTHGGQIRVRDSQQRLIRRRRKAGLHRQKDSQIYITRGIGTVVLPFRYQCPPEVTLLEFRTSK